MYRVDALRTPSRLRAGYPTLLQWRGRYDFSRLKTSRLLQHTSVLVIECFLTRLILFLKCIYTLFTVIFFTSTIPETLFEVNHSLFFCCLLRCVEFSRSLTMSVHVGRLSAWGGKHFVDPNRGLPCTACIFFCHQMRTF